jgi:hypothetical protein
VVPPETRLTDKVSAQSLSVEGRGLRSRNERLWNVVAALAWFSAAAGHASRGYWIFHVFGLHLGARLPACDLHTCPLLAVTSALQLAHQHCLFELGYRMYVTPRGPTAKGPIAERHSRQERAVAILSESAPVLRRRCAHLLLSGAVGGRPSAPATLAKRCHSIATSAHCFLTSGSRASLAICSAAKAFNRQVSGSLRIRIVGLRVLRKPRQGLRREL